jgi:uncharacterized protein (TIGR00297 family)
MIRDRRYNIDDPARFPMIYPSSVRRTRHSVLLMTFAPLTAVLVSLAIATAGWGLRALTGGGAIAATLVGTLILLRTGVPGLLALGAFFVGATLISRLAPDRTGALDGKGTRRDAVQVFANGAAASLGGLVPGAGLWIVTASLAAAAADTWATSTGAWSRAAPRDILRWHPVPPGTSGGVTIAGTAGALVGAASVGVAAALGAGMAALFPLALVVGMLGMLADSVLGAALQGRFHCDACDLATEQRVHRCGQTSRATGGIRWLSNDGVNALATAASALAGLVAWQGWAR